MGAEMGCPKREGPPFCHTDAKEGELRCIQQACGLTDRHMQRLLAKFREEDCDKRGFVYRHEFFRFFKIPDSGFAKRAFTLMDSDQDDTIDFCEFVSCSFCYCTYDKVSLSRFAYDLFDQDGSTDLTMDEVRNLVEFVYGGGLDASVQRILNVIDEDKSGTVSFKEFYEIKMRYPQLLYPAFELQTHLMRSLLGADFWSAHVSRITQLYRQREMPLRFVLQEIRKAFEANPNVDQDKLMAHLTNVGEPRFDLAARGKATAKKEEKQRPGVVRQNSWEQERSLRGSLKKQASWSQMKDTMTRKRVHHKTPSKVSSSAEARTLVSAGDHHKDSTQFVVGRVSAVKKGEEKKKRRRDYRVRALD